jgi:hypothetical protein
MPLFLVELDEIKDVLENFSLFILRLSLSASSGQCASLSFAHTQREREYALQPGFGK